MQIKNKPHKPYLQVNQLVQVVLESPTYERKHKIKIVHVHTHISGKNNYYRRLTLSQTIKEIKLSRL